jgi:hypothetical protein
MDKVILEKVKPIQGKNNRLEFTQEEAKNLLKYEKARGFKEWQLPKDSPYQLQTNGDLIKRGGPANIEGAQTSGGDKPGEGKAGEA